MTARGRQAGGAEAPRPRLVITSQGTLRMLTDTAQPVACIARAMALTEPFEVVWETSGDPARLAERLYDADLLVTENEVPISAEMLGRAPRLRLVQINGHRCTAVDLAAARSRGIVVATVPLVTSEGVAEHTLALMLALARRILPGDRAVRAAVPSPGRTPVRVVPGRAAYNWVDMTGIRLLSGARLTILGLGEIGTGVALRARALGMRVGYWQRHRLAPVEEERLGVRYLSFEEGLRQADWLSVHVRFTEETRGLLGAHELALLPPTACVINTARGPIIDEAALVEALQRGRLAGAGLDVYWIEPPPSDHPLHTLDNVVLSPHCAGGDVETAFLEVTRLFDELRRVWAGQAPTNPVTI
ncbi:MAG: 2-hydroxyacid dehydrogenase [Candidatus Rokuibacteriota bacterium]